MPAVLPGRRQSLAADRAGARRGPVPGGPDALVGGYTRALLAAALFVGAVVLIGLRAANTKGEPPGGTPTEITGVAIPGEGNSTARFPAHSDEETTFPA